MAHSKLLSHGCKSSLWVRGWAMAVLLSPDSVVYCHKAAGSTKNFSFTAQGFMFTFQIVWEYQSPLHKPHYFKSTWVSVLGCDLFVCLFLISLLFTAHAGTDRYLWTLLLKTSWEIWGLKYSAIKIQLPMFPVIKYTRMMQSWNVVGMFKAIVLYPLSHFRLRELMLFSL